MSRTNLSMSISADGYVAGPDRARQPAGGRRPAVAPVAPGPAADHPVNRQVVSNMMDGMGATIMGAQHVRPDSR